MAEKLQAGPRKELPLGLCPFCGSVMDVICEIMPKKSTYVYDIGCSNPDCIISMHSHDCFYVCEGDLTSFLECFNSRYYVSCVQYLPVRFEFIPHE